MCKRIALVCLSTQIINKIFLYFGVDLIAFYNCLSITYIGILYPLSGVTPYYELDITSSKMYLYFRNLHIVIFI